MATERDCWPPEVTPLNRWPAADGPPACGYQQTRKQALLDALDPPRDTSETGALDNFMQGAQADSMARRRQSDELARQLQAIAKPTTNAPKPVVPEAIAKAIDAYRDCLIYAYVPNKLQKAARLALEQAIASELSAKNGEIHDLVWNLAGCSTYAMGYGLDTEHSQEIARPALNDVRKMAIELETLRAENERLRGLYDAACLLAGTNQLDAMEWRDYKRMIAAGEARE